MPLPTSGDAPADGYQHRWPQRLDLAVPVVVVLVQLTYVPWLAALAGEPLSVPQLWLSAAGIASAGAALVPRRVCPATGFTVVVGVEALARFWLPETGQLGFVAATLVALFSLAVHRGVRATVVGATIAAVLAAVHTPGGWDWALVSLAGDALVFGLVATFGQLRRRRTAHRAAVVRRMADADRERYAAAEEERARLARDLHDIAGHHLSAVVVHAEATRRLIDRQPELAADALPEALRLAATSGRDVLVSLARLVNVTDSEPASSGRLETWLAALAGKLTGLGVGVTVEVDGRVRHLPVAVATAAYRIVQESLTNAIRHAPGAPVTVRVTYQPSAVEIVVDNAAAVGTPVPVPGSGRGVAGMRA
ncbi:MAG: sensor histidine kinase, partial [Micromonosporaceae bacterium]